MFNTFWKGLWGRKRRLLGTSAAVVLGVAFLVATVALGDTMRAGFDGLYSESNAGSAVVVRNSTVIGTDSERQRGPVDAALLVRLQGVDGVAAVAPTVGGAARILDAHGHGIGGNGPPTLGGGWIDNARLNPYRLATGRAPVPVPSGQPVEVVIDRRSAREGDLHVGDHTTIKVPDPLAVTVVGIVTFGEADSLGPVTYAGFAEDIAAGLFAKPGTVDSFRIAAEPGVAETTLRDRVAGVLPPGTQAITGTELTGEQMADIETDFLGTFRMVLLVFAVIAVFVAAFSIHNTFSILGAQRTRETALLRAVGGSRRQVLAGAIGEALAVGAAASALGIAAGFGLAHGLKAFTDANGLDLGHPGVELRLRTIGLAISVGVGVTVLAGVMPAIRASRVSPMAALGEVSIDRSGTSLKRGLAGILLAAAGIALVATAAAGGDGALSQAGLGALLTLVGVIGVAPVMARPIAGLLGEVPALLRGPTGKLSRRNAMRNPRRTAGSAVALMVGTAIVALFTTFGASLKETLNRIVDDKFAGDLVLVDEDSSGGGISSRVAADLAALPEVSSAVGMSFGAARIGGHDETTAVADPAGLAALLDLDIAGGSLATMHPGQLALSTKYARTHHVEVGDELPVAFADGGAMNLTVAALYGARSSLGADVIMTPADWAPHTTSHGDTVVFVDLRPGVPTAQGAAAVDTLAERWTAPPAQTRREYKRTIGKEIDQMVTFIYALLGIAVLIALMSIANTLSLSIHERTRELGLLRAVGQARPQLRSTIRWEAVIVAVYGTVVGLSLGTFLGWGLMRALDAQEGFGAFAAPVTALAVILGLAALAGVLAAARPARRAAKLDVLAALAQA